MRLATSFISMLLIALPATGRAQTADGAECRTGLARAETLIGEIAARDRAGPIADPQRLCARLRLNLRQMREARTIMNRCMTGHARRENVGQMDVSMEDIATVLARRCS